MRTLSRSAQPWLMRARGAMAKGGPAKAGCAAVAVDGEDEAAVVFDGAVRPIVLDALPSPSMARTRAAQPHGRAGGRGAIPGREEAVRFPSELWKLHGDGECFYRTFIFSHLVSETSNTILGRKYVSEEGPFSPK